MLDQSRNGRLLRLVVYCSLLYCNLDPCMCTALLCPTNAATVNICWLQLSSVCPTAVLSVTLDFVLDVYIVCVYLCDCRDSMSFATKLCHVVYADGSAHDVMKHPRTDSSKISLPGMLLCWCCATVFATVTPPCPLRGMSPSLPSSQSVSVLHRCLSSKACQWRSYGVPC